MIIARARQWPYYLMCLLIGLVLAVAKIFYSFFPFFNIVDVLLFGLAGFLLTVRRPIWYWLCIVLICLPTMVDHVLTLWRLGLEDLKQGIGTGWALSAVLIPLAAFLGGYVAIVIKRRAG